MATTTTSTSSSSSSNNNSNVSVGSNTTGFHQLPGMRPADVIWNDISQILIDIDHNHQHLRDNDYELSRATNDEQRQKVLHLRLLNKELILSWLSNPAYVDFLNIYPDQPGPVDNGPNFGYGEPTLQFLPQLYWKIFEFRIHPCGVKSDSHWRFSLKTALGKRTFVNAHNEYLAVPFSQTRIGPGRDPAGPNADNSHNELDVSFPLKLDAKPKSGTDDGGVWRLYDFLSALLHPPSHEAPKATGGNAPLRPEDVVRSYDDDGVKPNRPICWFLYQAPDVPLGTKTAGAIAKQCRHFVQCAARIFRDNKMLAEDPNPTFYQANVKLGFDGQDGSVKGIIPKGTFLAEQPGTHGIPAVQYTTNLNLNDININKALYERMICKVEVQRYPHLKDAFDTPGKNRTPEQKMWLKTEDELAASQDWEREVKTLRDIEEMTLNQDDKERAPPDGEKPDVWTKFQKDFFLKSHRAIRWT